MTKNTSDLVMVSQGETELDGSDTSNSDSKITNPFDPAEIRVETKNTQMDALIKRIKNGEIDLSPGFQRQAGIWTNQTQSRLIESMLIRIPLPAFYMDASDDNKWLVVDGLQRLTTVRRFVIDKVLVLEGLEFLTQYNGKKFDEIPRNLQRRIDETDIVIYQIQPGTPLRVKFDIFKRINTGGAPLSSQEIRHALNQGQITKLLQELAESSEFKTATDNGVASKRMADRECVLRFIAFTMYPPSEYNFDSFDQFLNEAMMKANQLLSQDLQKMATRFKEIMAIAYAIFGNDAFRKRFDTDGSRFPVNKALFEAWSVNLGLLDENAINTIVKKKEAIRRRFISLMKDSEFEASVTQGTGSIRRVKYRFKLIKELLLEEAR